MILSVHQYQYIPWLGYFDKIAKSDCFVFLDTVQYKGREYQNRNKIRTKDGEMWLTVPVLSKGLGRQAIGDVKIDNSVSWKQDHWRGLQCAYNQAPFFQEYRSFFEETYSRNWLWLKELNLHIIYFVLRELSITTPLYFESELGITTTRTDRIIEICKKLNADTYLTGIGGEAYLEEEKFPEANITLQYQQFVHPEYHQVHMKWEGTFLPFMSILDLLFNVGKQSNNILKTNKQ